MIVQSTRIFAKCCSSPVWVQGVGMKSLRMSSVCNYYEYMGRIEGMLQLSHVNEMEI